MKVTPLALLTIFAASSSAFGLNGGAKSVARATRSAVSFQKPALVQAVDVHGNRLGSSALGDASADASDALSVRGGAAASAPAKSGGIDFGLMAYFALWYLGNYYYNITNKLALNAAGGKTGFPMTISSLQLGVGALYAIYLWVAPDARKKPTITMQDLVKMIPVSFCFMGAHSASVFAMGMGAVSFAQIVKAAEPAFSAVLSQYVYGKPISRAKWLCLPVVIGGVILASVKELDFAWSALISACIANTFAAVKGNENKKLMDTPGIKDRLGSVGNQFALTTILGFLMSIPFVLAKEGSRLGDFFQAAKTTPAIWKNVVASGLWFYGYNECATMTLKKTNAVTQSVANTAKRVIVIIGVALVLGESLDPIKLLGCSIGIFGVFLYSIIDTLVAKKK
ncbi:triose-phosphate transporter family protein [Nitzschia inconspicua]|uniref:Triose-phosphate transporter family protein n=1 Tax=Nitzschia inconspicua TaxID=303405 RepID=A0A9K3L4H1_9STRA|nr:triose-phosphate transporter family protein [Nitzschia inconspicua]